MKLFFLQKSHRLSNPYNHPLTTPKRVQKMKKLFNLLRIVALISLLIILSATNLS
jgi:hypothetical protein